MLERKSHISVKLDYKYTFNTDKIITYLPTHPISGVTPENSTLVLAPDVCIKDPIFQSSTLFPRVSFIVKRIKYKYIEK
jgi:hypothetical protein